MHQPPSNPLASALPEPAPARPQLDPGPPGLDPTPSPPRERRRRSDGQRSHGAILQTAARLATLEGLSGLSLARLADAVGMSKSGLFAHFHSKEDLQLATIETASALFAQQVTEPASHVPSASQRLRALTDGYLAYLERETFPGGCFFASTLAEMDTQPGPVRDRLVAFLNDWLTHLHTAVHDAQTEGTLDPAEDPDQLTFEIEAALLLANAQYIVTRAPEPIERARRAIHRRLGWTADTATT
jgi:AcrR family transcriptional regulator